MKVYVDGELHKDCVSCSHLYLNNADTYSCSLLREVVGANIYDCAGQRHKDCPYKSLADYTKQVRREVLDKVYKVLEQTVPHDLCWSWAVIKKELDQIQGETK